MSDVSGLAMVAATVVATGALERVGGGAVTVAADRLAALRSRVAGWLADNDDDTGELVEAHERALNRQSDLSIQGLADAIKVAASKDPDGAAKIAELVRELSPDAAGAGPSFENNLSGRARVKNITQVAGDMTIQPKKS